MDIKLNLITFGVLLAWMSCATESRYIPNQYNSDDSDVEFVTESPGEPGVGGPTNIFKDWMNFIQGFFKEGNWSNGGPTNFARFIGNQVSKLVQMLTRDDNGVFGK